MSDARHRPRPRRPLKLPRAEALIALTLVFVALLLGWLCIKVVSQDRDLKTSNAARDALARQVESLGQTPVAGPPGSRGDPGQSGVVGARGPAGPSGPSGAPGKDAPTIIPSPGPTGPPGPSGQPGADSTVPGPTGPAGADGASGAPGQNGSDGKDGAPPSSWTYTDQDGREYRCVPVDDFDPDAPDYRCTQTAGPTTEPDPSSAPDPQPSPSPSDTASSGLLPLGLLNNPRRT